MRWTVRRHGDFDEQHFGHYLESTLPNYEVFWAMFIVPLTERPRDITFRPDVDPTLRRMAMAHYSVFWHLVTAHRLLNAMMTLPGEMALFFDSILFHMSAATEMVEDFLFVWAQIESRTEDKRVSGVSPFSADKALEKATRFIDSKAYQKATRQFQERGRPVNISLHTERDAFHYFLEEAGAEAQAAYKDFDKISRRVRHYRNTVAHNPILGKLMQTPGILLVPREEKLSQYDEWVKVFQSPRREDFVEATELGSAFLRETEETINTLWQHMIPYCQKLSRKSAYQHMVGYSPSESLWESRDRRIAAQSEGMSTSGSAVAPPARSINTNAS